MMLVMLQTVLPVLIQTVLPLVVLIVGTLVADATRRFLAAHAQDQRVVTAARLAEQAVRAAEQVYPPGANSSKLTFAIKTLQAYFPSLSEPAARMYVEAAVHSLQEFLTMESEALVPVVTPLVANPVPLAVPSSLAEAPMPPVATALPV